MACEYYEESSGWFGNTYGYCTAKSKNGEAVSSDQYYKYCKWDGRDCPSYPDSGGICFITRAVVGYKGLPDKGYIMTVIRKFRDSKMAMGDVMTYYTISPQITAKLDCMRKDEQDLILAYIWDRIEKAVNLIKEGRDEDAYKVYTTCLEETAHRVGV